MQNFLSAGVGIAVAVALIRGIIGRSGKSIGNFWHDLIRTVLWVLTPLAFVVALLLVFQGSIQNFSHYLNFNGPTGLANQIAMGLVAPRRRSRSSGRTAAASSTRTRPIRSRTRPGSPTSSRCCPC